MNSFLEQQLESIRTELTGMKPAEGLLRASTLFPDAVTFSTSFSQEDQIITHLIAQARLPIQIFTLDTGRLFPETYRTWSRTIEKMGVTIQTWYPQATPLASFVTERGPNAFYESTENRMLCCRLRKVEPLSRALAGQKLWITGIRAAHSSNRKEMPQVEWDAAHGVIKYHPMLHATDDEIHSWIRQWDIPTNPLYDQGFVSIGCAPCTRAIQPGEDPRAGRWWWEDASKKECGLHTTDTTPSPHDKP